MPLEEVDKVINGTKYKITKLPAVQGRKLLFKLSKMAGSMYTAFEGENPEMDTIVNALDQIKERDLEDLCKLMGVYTQVKLSEGWKQLSIPVQDDYFSGKYDEMFEWLKVALEVNFSSFFEKLKNLKDSDQESPQKE